MIRSRSYASIRIIKEVKIDEEVDNREREEEG